MAARASQPEPMRRELQKGNSTCKVRDSDHNEREKENANSSLTRFPSKRGEEKKILIERHPLAKRKGKKEEDDCCGRPRSEGRKKGGERKARPDSL